MSLSRQSGGIVLNQQCCCDCFPDCLPTGTKLNATIEGITAAATVVNPCSSVCNPYGEGIVTVDLTSLNGAYVLRNVATHPKNRFYSAGACDGNSPFSGPCDANAVRASGFPALVTIIPPDGCSPTEEHADYLSWLEIDLDCDRETGQMFILDCLFVVQCSVYKPIGYSDGEWHCWPLYYGFGSGGQYPIFLGPDQFTVLDTAKACKAGGSFLGRMRTQVKWPLLEGLGLDPFGCDHIQQSTSFSTGFITGTIDFSP